MKSRIYQLTIFFLVLFLLFPFLASAQSNSNTPPPSVHGSAQSGLGVFLQPEVSGYNIQISETDQFLTVFVLIIQVVFSLLGVVFFFLILYGGFIWLTAGGNEEQIKKAKDLLKNALIGLAIILSAYAIVYFVLYWVSEDLYNTGLFGANRL